MDIWKFLCLCFIIQGALASFNNVEENEFAEFEDFDESDSSFIEEEITPQEENESDQFVPLSREKESEKLQLEESDEEVKIEEEIDVDPEFEHFQDADEFEGFEEKEEKPASEPKITIAKVPVNLMLNWESYYLEILMVTGLVAYFMNYMLGRTKNSKIANSWFQAHKQLLEENFALVGDDGSQERNEHVNLVKESESVYLLWCSGRTCCEGMLVELRLIKRHDLVGLVGNLMKPSLDQIHITVMMNKEDMDNFIFSVASKKTAAQMTKDLQDISIYCPERKSGDRLLLPPGFQVMSETSEAISILFDDKINAIFHRYPEYIDYIHFSDQFSGVKPQEDANSSAPNISLDVDKVLRFGFNLPTKGVPIEEAITRLKPLMNMVFYFIDQVKKYRLSKEGKLKARKSRQKVEGAFLKSTHQARAEAAAAVRLEKRVQERERVMAEDNPEKQRRWEIKEEKRQAKKRAPRMKQLKVKAL